MEFSNQANRHCHPWSPRFHNAHLVPDPGTPYTRPSHTLYLTVSHLVPDCGTPCTRTSPTLYQTLPHLVPDPATSCTWPCQSTASRGRMRPDSMRIINEKNWTSVRAGKHPHVHFLFSQWHRISPSALDLYDVVLSCRKIWIFAGPKQQKRWLDSKLWDKIESTFY